MTCSGFLYWVIIYPIDTMKSIIQTDEHYAAQVSGKGMQRYSMMSKYIAKTIGGGARADHEVVEGLG